MNFSKILIFLLFSSVILTNDGCKKKDDVVPYTRVNFTLYLGDPEYVTLQTIGNHYYANMVGGAKVGVCGIIIYRKSQDEFSALERCCTYNASERCAVLLDSTNNLALKCPCCGSKFSILDGSVMSGSAERSLTNYQTIFNSEENTLKVYN